MRIDTAAYDAAKSAFEDVHATSWPIDIAEPARRCAEDMLASLTESLDEAEAPAARRRCLRGALLKAVELATICDYAQAQGLGAGDSLCSAGKAVSLLGMSYHATSVAKDGL